MVGCDKIPASRRRDSSDDWAHLIRRSDKQLRQMTERCVGLVNTNTNMNNKNLTIVALVAANVVATLLATENPMVGGASMYRTKDIIQNAMNSKDHTTLVTAVKAAGLVETLQGKGPFTVFAPTNEAFEKLPAGTVDTLLKPENKEKLAAVLTYHVVPGKITVDKLAREIKAGDGSAQLTTVNGEKLTARMVGDSIELTDVKGGMSKVKIADVIQSNGVIYVIDTVLMP